jgi:Tfp pilus assembly protein PilV
MVTPRRQTRRRLRARSGMTLVEVLIAVIMLVVGVLAFVGASAATARMLNRGNRSVKAAFYAQEQLETLAATPCPVLADGSATRQSVYQMAWTITDAPGGQSKRVKLIAVYPAAFQKTRADTMETSVLCIR